MRVAILLSFSLVIAVGLLAACNSQEAVLPQAPSTPVQGAQTKNPADEARRITAEDLHKLWDKKDVLIIDTRPEPDYKASHIPGSISVPASEVATKLEELPRNKMIVAYCTWPHEHTSAGAVLTLKEKGFDNAAALLGGLNAWKTAGYPVEGTAAK